MTQPVLRKSNGDYDIGGRTFYGFSKTKNVMASFALERWRQGRVVLGLAAKVASKDLTWAQKVNGADNPQKVANGVAFELLRSDKAAADLGTEVHDALDHVHMGAAVSSLPGHLRPYVEGFLAAEAEHGWVTLLSETTVANVDLGYAGTADRHLRFPGLGVVVADVKTGKAIYGDVAIQLAAYSRCTHQGSHAGLTDLDLDVNQRRGVAFHVTAEGTTPYVIDLDPGWSAWLACLDLRRWQEEEPRPAPVGPGLHPRRVEWLQRRLAAVKANPKATASLAEVWPAGVPTPKVGGWTTTHVDAIAAVLVEVERLHVMPFPDPDPAGVWSPPVTVGGVDLGDLVARLAALPSDLLLEAQALAKASDDPVPNLRKDPGRVTEAHVQRVQVILAEAEAKAAQRRQTVLALSDSVGMREPDVARLVSFGNRTDLGDLTVADVERLRAVAAAKAEGLLEVVDGRARSTGRAAAVIKERRGDDLNAVAVAVRGVEDIPDVPAPRSLNELCINPLLAALAASA